MRHKVICKKTDFGRFNNEGQSYEVSRIWGYGGIEIDMSDNGFITNENDIFYYNGEIISIIFVIDDFGEEFAKPCRSFGVPNFDIDVSYYRSQKIINLINET